MESLIGLVNRIQRACTVLGDYGGEGMSLWEALPSVAVVGGQVFYLYSFFLFFNFLISLLWSNRFSYIAVEMHVEFWKIFSFGKRCWQRFPSSWIW